MELSPRYGDPEFVRWDIDLGDLAAITAGQRARLLATLQALSDGQWATQSRCDRWSVADVVSHLTTTNGFWSMAVEAGVAGSPTEVLGGFDPVSTPEVLVDAGRARTPGEVLDAFASSVAALDASFAAVEDWGAVAEAPPGHVPIAALAAHALWDAWLHERDVVVPLGFDPVEASDEIRIAAAYAVALPVVIAVDQGSSPPPFAVVTDGADEPIVAAGAGDSTTVTGGPIPDDAVVLDGSTAELVDALAGRRVPRPALPGSLRRALSVFVPE